MLSCTFKKHDCRAHRIKREKAKKNLVCINFLYSAWFSWSYMEKFRRITLFPNQRGALNMNYSEEEYLDPEKTNRLMALRMKKTFVILTRQATHLT